MLRGTAQNPDVFFQAREAANPYLPDTPGDRRSATMDRFADADRPRATACSTTTARPDAERVLVLMGSGAEAAARDRRRRSTRAARGSGVAQGPAVPAVHAPRTSSRALPATVRHIAVLDRTKEPGAVGEPLYQDVVAALARGDRRRDAPFRFVPRVIGGRYGLGSKEFTPAMAAAVFERARRAVAPHATSPSASPTT